MRTRSNVPRTTDPLDWVEKKQDPPGTVVRFVSHEIGKFQSNPIRPCMLRLSHHYITLYFQL